MSHPVFHVPDDVLTREVDGELVLLNLRTEQYYGLDAVGADMVRRLTSAPYDDALAALRKDYDVEPERLEHDVEQLLAALLRAGLLQRSRTG